MNHENWLLVLKILANIDNWPERLELLAQNNDVTLIASHQINGIPGIVTLDANLHDICGATISKISEIIKDKL
jgi:hypothetical protein